jgi:hypothetical protein
MIPHVQPKGTNIRFEKLNMYPQLKLVTSSNPTCCQESINSYQLFLIKAFNGSEETKPWCMLNILNRSCIETTEKKKNPDED